MTKSNKKEQRKLIIKNYQPSPEKVAQEREERERLVELKAEYYDILTTEDALNDEPEKVKK